MALKQKTLLGKMLVQAGLINEEQLRVGLKEQQQSGGFLGTILVRLGFIKEEELLRTLSKQLNIEYVKIGEMHIDAEAIKKVAAKFAHHYKLMPIRLEQGVLTIAVTDPLDIRTLDDIKLFLGLEVKAVLAAERDISEGIKRYYGVGADTIEKMIDETPAGAENIAPIAKTEDIEELAHDASIIKFVNQVFLEAVRDRATDIHLEPYEDAFRVRYRIDGVLYDTVVPATIKQFQSAICSRIKIMANLNIAERRLPQDGRIRIKVGNQELDLRVSILPTSFGESVVIRILSSSMLYSLAELGLSQDELEILNTMIKKPHGIIFVTGPTGSGKTTTLYACLSKINNKDKKIITIEDPVEYQLKGITQIQVAPKIGLSFAHGLRSMLRHDPDIMMVGEVRDLETAEITIRVALTGHLVFSTLHTNDAAGAITRLLDMGIEPYLVSSSVECIIAQRLVRLICPDCKEQTKVSPESIKELGISELPSNTKLYEGKGCKACKFTGYRGRTGIYEFLPMTDALKEMVLQRTSSNQIKKRALELGMHTLREAGWVKVLEGLTTVSEVIRVTQQEELIG